MAPGIERSPVRRTRPREGDPRSITSSYTALLQRVRDERLLERTRAFYLLLLSGLTLALAGALTGLVVLGETWFQLLIAAGLGILFTQFAFVAHEASHRQVLVSGTANDRLGRWIGTAIVGMSYQWWMTRHTRHHVDPNRIGRDPDIDDDLLSFHRGAALARRGLGAWFVRRQGRVLFPLMVFAGVNLHRTSVQSLLRRGPVKGRMLELGILTVRFTAYFALVFGALPVGMACAFVGVQLAVFGLYLGASFAPNHLGLPIVPRDARLDFLRKQVLMSRNISGGRAITMLLGGLDHQIEHHLFPSMPRPHLARARAIVREHCADLDVRYTETTLVGAWAEVQRHMATLTAPGPDVFDCPALAELRPV